MAVTPDKVQIGTSNDYLDGVSVDTAAGTGLFRETVVIADPETGGGLANVRRLDAGLLAADMGIVTHSLIQGASTVGGGSYHDVKVTPSGALTVESTVTGTVTANLGNLNGAATEANQTTGNNSLAAIDGKLPDLSGAWGYDSGVSGSVTIGAGRRVLQITAAAGASGATMTINGGQTITLPALTSIAIEPCGNLTAPTIVFTNTSAYFVEHVG